MKHIFAIFASSLLLQSCQNFFSQTLDTDPPPYDKALVFHELVSRDDKGIRIPLTRNFGVFDPIQNDSVFFVRGAMVEWWENGQKVLNLLPINADSSFVYEGQFPTPLQEGNNYEIRVSHPDFETVVAQQQMPRQIAPLENVKLVREVVKDEYGQPIHELSFTLNDDPAVENFYEILMSYDAFFLEYLGADPQGNPIFDTVFVESYLFFDTTFDPNIAEGFGNTKLVNDQFFNGSAYTFVGRFSPAFQDGGADTSVYNIKVRSVTKEYYRWSVSARKQSNNQDNPFAEPVSVYTNLEKGLGIFGMFSEKSTKVQ